MLREPNPYGDWPHPRLIACDVSANRHPRRLFYTRSGQKQRHASAAHDAALRVHDR